MSDTASDAKPLPEGWELSRPPTRLELLGLAASKWLARGGLALALLAVLFLVVIAVPGYAVMTSPAYRAAQQVVIDSPDVPAEIGEVVSFEKIPVRYKLETDRAELVFHVQGAIAHGTAAATVVRADGTWSVTSASFVSDPRLPGVHRRLVLVRGSR